MIYSVWNYGTRTYDYYQSNERTGTHAPTPPRARGSTAIGATPEQAAWPLPTGARRVGTGAAPRGRIATSGTDDTFGLEPWMIGVGVIAAWYLFGKQRS